MKKQKRILSFLLAVVMVMALLPTGVFAQEEVALSREEMFARIPVSSVRRPQNFLEAELATGKNDMTIWEQNATEAEREAIFQEVVSLTDRLVSGKTSETEKVKAIYQWVRTNVSYDWGELHGINYFSPDWNDGLFAYSTGYAVCQGYSRLCHLMLNLAGLSGAMVTSHDLAHTWNVAYADGKWITFDATQSKWDDSRHIDYIEYYDNEGFLYTIFDDGVVWCSWAGTEDTCPEVIVAPDGVTKLKSFECNEKLTSVVIPGSVTTLDQGVFGFNNCKNLTSVTMLDGITSIGSYAFSNCKRLTSATIPNSVTEIGEYAFAWCDSLTDVYYGGTETQWKATKINGSGGGNKYLTAANIHYNSPMPSQPVVPTAKTAAENVQTVKVDGKDVSFAMYSPDNGGTNYVRLVDLAVALKGTAGQFNVGYDGKVLLTTGVAYMGAASTAPFHSVMEYTMLDEPTYVNGVAKNLEGIRFEYQNGGYTYYKLRDLGQALGFNVGWDNATQKIYIESGKPYDPNN